MRNWRATWICLAAVLVGSLLPWAKVDLDKVAENDDFGGFAVAMLRGMGGNVQITAWNGRVTVGTAHIPAWTVLLAGTIAATLFLLRARGVRTLPHGASQAFALAGAALAITFGVQALETGPLLVGYTIAALGAVLVAVSVLRDPVPEA